MPRLILVKHSLPEIVSTIPAKQWTLSETGRQRCQALADMLVPYSPDIIVSSLEPKAAETAQIVARALDKPITPAEDLHEHDRTGLGLLEAEAFEASVKVFFALPDRLVMGRETANHARDRFCRAVESVERANIGKNILIVAHGTVITLFVQKYNHVDAFPFWQRLGLPSFVVLSLLGHECVKIVERVA